MTVQVVANYPHLKNIGTDGLQQKSIASWWDDLGLLYVYVIVHVDLNANPYDVIT